MNDSVLKYLHWIVIAIIIIAAIIVAPNLIGKVFGAFAGVFKTIFQSAKDVGGGLKDKIPPLHQEAQPQTQPAPVPIY